MATKGRRAALLDRRHDLELTEAHMPRIGPAPVGPIAMKDVCDLQPRAAHRRPVILALASRPPSVNGTSRSSGLVTVRITSTGSGTIGPRQRQL